MLSRYHKQELHNLFLCVMCALALLCFVCALHLGLRPRRCCLDFSALLGVHGVVLWFKGDLWFD